MNAKLFSLTHIRFFFLVLLIPSTAFGQGAERSETFFERISKKEGDRITLETDLTTIIANKRSEEYYPGMLTTGDGKSYVIELKPRGKFRRKIAEIPPLKIKIKKKLLTAEGLVDTLNEVKLVLPCFDNPKGDELLIKEYLAYRMFEQLTSASVRARLVRLTIRDTHVEKSKKMFAILLEDEEETVVRLNGQLVEQYGISPDSLIANQAALVAVFEYMIGNTDWDISMVRNVRLIKSQEGGKILVVPYDFDFAGLVAAPYASPSSESGLKTVRDRFMMANGIDAESMKRAVSGIKVAKKDLYDICRSRYLSREAALDMIAYLETFFQQIEDKDEVPSRYVMPPAE
ncbi:MAG: hypothetical protein R2791_13290 [Saprospiraceae bacterium]|nr:hypothetical protein [Saprospiraceae bacterium]